MREWSLGFWQWLHDASQGQAAFLGSLTGSAIGLIALLLGALFNAHLNRKRDDRLRREEQRSVATALKAELAGFNRTLLTNSEALKKETNSPEFLLPDLARSIRIMPQMVSKFGLLDQKTIESVAPAYSALEHYGENLLAIGGHVEDLVTPGTGNRRLVSVPANNAPRVIEMISGVLDLIQKAIAQLNVFVGSIR
jgi:hypothetical protein